MVLKLKNIKVKNIVKGVNLELKKNKIMVLLGRNGAGKSTFAKAIMGLIDYKGYVYLDGKRIDKLKSNERVKQGITIVLQNPPEIPLSVKRLFYSIEKDEDIIRKYLKTFKLDENILDRELKDNQLSGGERKKVEVISALLLNPKILILDEVDAGLDIKSKKILASVLKNKTVLIITHDVEFAKLIGESVAIMENGRIVKEGGKEVIKEYVGKN